MASTNLQNPSNVGDIINMLVHVQISSSGLQKINTEMWGLEKCSNNLDQPNDPTTSPSLEWSAGSSSFGILLKLLLFSSGIANLEKPNQQNIKIKNIKQSQ